MDKIIKWFYIGWWKYLLRKGDNPNFTNRINRFFCRVKNHPCGIIFYNVSGSEPDYRCKNCGDEL